MDFEELKQEVPSPFAAQSGDTAPAPRPRGLREQDAALRALMGNPVQQAITQADVRQSNQQDAITSGLAPARSVSDIAKETQVPANVLDALEEIGIGAEDGAALIQGHTETGLDPAGAIFAEFGDKMGARMVERAYQIADERYAQPDTLSDTADDEPQRQRGTSFTDDVARGLAGTVVRGVGGFVEYTGRAIEGMAEGLAQSAANILGRELPENKHLVSRASEAAGNYLRSVGEKIKDGITPETKAAIEGSAITGELLDPSTWEFGDQPSIRGYGMLATEVLGSLLPVVATAVVTKNPYAAGAVGGGMAGGEAAETARAIVDAAVADGTIEANAYYNAQLNAGKSPDEAVRKMKDAAGQTASLLVAPIAAFGDTLTGGLVTGALKTTAGRGALTRALAGAVVGGAEEGLQEVAESIGAKFGTSGAVGLDVDYAEGTFGDFVLGAMGGGTVGAIGQAAAGRQIADPDAPAPTADLETPTRGRGIRDAERALAGVVAEQAQIEAQTQADLVAQAQADAQGTAEAKQKGSALSLWPDLKPAQRIVLTDETGDTREVVFLGERDGKVRLRLEGQEIVFDGPEFEQMRRQAGEQAAPQVDGGNADLATETVPGADRPQDTPSAPVDRAEVQEDTGQPADTPQAAPQGGVRTPAEPEVAAQIAAGKSVVADTALRSLVGKIAPRDFAALKQSILRDDALGADTTGMQTPTGQATTGRGNVSGSMAGTDGQNTTDTPSGPETASQTQDGAKPTTAGRAKTTNNNTRWAGMTLEARRDIIQQVQPDLRPQALEEAVSGDLDTLQSAEFAKPLDAALRAMNTRTADKRETSRDTSKRGDKGKPATALTFKSIEPLAARMRDLGLPDRVALHVARNLTGKGAEGSDISLAGQYRDGLISVALGGQRALETLNHEAIHALRSETLWGRKYGLFEEAEWRALVKHARADKRALSSVAQAYPDYTTAQQIEEVIADQFFKFAQGESLGGELHKLLNKVAQFFTQLRAMLDGGIAPGVVKARIDRGDVGKRGGTQTSLRSETGAQSRGVAAAMIGEGKTFWQRGAAHIKSAISVNAGDSAVSYLALIPGRPLFREIGAALPSAGQYLDLKAQLDADRNEMQAKGSNLVDAWRDLARKDADLNDTLMEVMHQSSAYQMDPTEAHMQRLMDGDLSVTASQQSNARELMGMWKALPPSHRKMYVRVRDFYKRQGEAFEAELLAQVQVSIDIAVKRAKRTMQTEFAQINQENLAASERSERRDAARKKYQQAKGRAEASKATRMKSLRSKFEANKVAGPYFPLQRFGDYFVVIKDSDGAVYSFDKFETLTDQQDFFEQAKANPLFKGKSVSKGRQSNTADAESVVSADFVGEVQEMLAASMPEGADLDQLSDAIWQQYLNTLPSSSVRTNRIHRKGTQGWYSDAARTLAHQAFHGAHQLSKLRYGQRMKDILQDTKEEARTSGKSEKLMPLYDEMERRHAWVMNPKTHRIATWATSAAFVYYLSVTPAAALINLSQTVMLGIPIMNARFKKSGVGAVSKELAKAAKDFGPSNMAEMKRMGLGTDKPISRGKVWSVRTANLAKDEKDAIREAYRLGVIDKSQAHELASVADSGVEYNSKREKVMRMVSYLFHHAEVANREVTFMAAYRLAKKEGMDPEAAIKAASEVTWDTHFDYSNGSRPRVSQGDWPKVFLTFRSHTINMIYRLSRDTHQMIKGETPEVRKEARDQLVGIMAAFGLGAGITGMPLYGLLIGVAALFSDGGSDEVEEKLIALATLDPDKAGAGIWNYLMGMAFKGVPGQVAGVDLSERIGMPNLWFRGGRDADDVEQTYSSYVKELLGPVPAMFESGARGLGMALEGDFQRGVETAAPKAIRDVMRAARYSMEGVTTRKGDLLLEDVTTGQIFAQAMGFTPAQIAERYQENSVLYARQKRIVDQRRRVLARTVDDLRGGKGLRAKTLAKIKAHNAEYPMYPITGATIRRSYRAGMSASARNQGGAMLNAKLDHYLRSTAGKGFYD